MMTTWTVDSSHSQVEFSVKHLMISNVRGSFGTFEGQIEMDESNLAASSVEGTVETASIDTRDTQRDTHLRSADFFDVEKYPAMHFRSTSIRPTDDGYEVKGDLTIRDTTKAVTFKVADEGAARDPWGKERRAFSAEATINRHDFGLNWNVALEAGGVLVGEKVKIRAEVEVVKQEEPAPASA